jgi:hypothetical protein
MYPGSGAAALFVADVLSPSGAAGWIARQMPSNGHLALCAPTTEGWWACAQDRRIVIRNGRSAFCVPVDGPLRWCRDDVDDLTFEEALDVVPDALHGWMALAGLIGLRQCLGGLSTGVALPVGCQEWPPMAKRAAPLQGWMKCLARLEAVDMPDLPPEVDDGLDGLGGGGMPPL